VNTIYRIYTEFSGPALVQGIINSSSQVIDLAHKNVSSDEIEIDFDSISLNDIKLVAAKADSYQVFGDTGEATFALSTDLTDFALCNVHEAADGWKYSPAEIRYTNNSTVEFNFDTPPGLLQANVLIAAGTQAIGNGSAQSFLINTGKTYRDLIIQVFEAGGDRRLVWHPDVIHNSTSQITVTFDNTPTTNQFIVAWADAHSIAEDMDSRYWMLSGANRHLGRGDQFNERVNVWAKQIKAKEGLDLITGTGGDGGFRLWDGGLVCGMFGYETNNYFKFHPDYYFSVQAGVFERLRITVDSIQLKTDTDITGDLEVSNNVTAVKYYGDTVDA
jgi:hypothetical protein